MSGSAARKLRPKIQRQKKGPASGCGSGAFVRLGADQLLLEEDGFTILLAGILFMAEVLRLFSSVLP